MNISRIDVRMNPSPYHKVKAYITLILEECLAIHDIAVIEGDHGIFVAMPSRHCSDGRSRDIVHPLDSGTRAELSAMCLRAYEQEKRKITL